MSAIPEEAVSKMAGELFGKCTRGLDPYSFHLVGLTVQGTREVLEECIAEGVRAGADWRMEQEWICSLCGKKGGDQFVCVGCWGKHSDVAIETAQENEVLKKTLKEIEARPSGGELLRITREESRQLREQCYETQIELQKCQAERDEARRERSRVNFLRLAETKELKEAFKKELSKAADMIHPDEELRESLQVIEDVRTERDTARIELEKCQEEIKELKARLRTSGAAWDANQCSMGLLGRLVRLLLSGNHNCLCDDCVRVKIDAAEKSLRGGKPV